MADEREMIREADIAAFAVREIEDAKLSPGEIEELENEHRLLSQAEKLFILFEELHSSLSETSGGALNGLRTGLGHLKELSKIDSSFSDSADRLENAFYETEDILDGIERYKNDFEFSPEKLAACEERLSEVLRLRKKYGDTVEEIFDFLEESRRKVSSIENREELKEEYAAKISGLEKTVLAEASELSKNRKASAVKLQAGIQQQLKALGMPKAEFRVTWKPGSEKTESPPAG